MHFTDIFLGVDAGWRGRVIAGEAGTQRLGCGFRVVDVRKKPLRTPVCGWVALGKEMETHVC